MVYPALLPLMRTPRLPVVEWTDAPADLSGLVRFAERRDLVSARVPSHFSWPLIQSRPMLPAHCMQCTLYVPFKTLKSVQILLIWENNCVTAYHCVWPLKSSIVCVKYISKFCLVLIYHHVMRTYEVVELFTLVLDGDEWSASPYRLLCPIYRVNTKNLFACWFFIRLAYRLFTMLTELSCIVYALYWKALDFLAVLSSSDEGGLLKKASLRYWNRKRSVTELLISKDLLHYILLLSRRRK